ncbi:N-acetylmuramoyl-L-alanine amidase family protein [Flavihumibacter petaseus]|uniref:N-acetylmuramoyl-L-alanine amidase n=1 Tax=Flavihumibacter petaseus NBRC 106054 TaxID=1220578 RepID=A0A0E9N4Y6_9BACT|nr:N-acetylmuramoyl-L-alanine amidase [Flavihumibacter petaseus]GAO44756.1 putative N-acetylmuramoyl-L-alanine amidase [Flavihumibacter petaseus NBRC 106054]
MLKMIKTSLSLTLAAVALLMFSQSIRAQGKNAIKTVIIDAGHGGRDPGARGLISTEAEVALQIALKLGKAMEAEFPQIKFIYTRTDENLPRGEKDPNVANRVRAQMANEAKGDLFISIHLNATGQKAGGWYAKRISGYKPKVVYVGKGKNRRKKTIQSPIYESYYVKNTRIGTETYIWAADRSKAKSENINAMEENESGEGEPIDDPENVLDLNSPEAQIRAQLYTKYYFRNSALLASMVEDEFEKEGRQSFGVKQRNNKGIWVLQATGMPSILVETGFITNKEEEEYLNSEKGQDEVVASVLNAFRRYKTELENAHHSQRPATGK